MSTKISELPTVSSADGSDLLVVVASGATSNITKNNLLAGIQTGRSRVLTHDNNGETLGIDIDIYYVDIVDFSSYGVILPDAGDMTNRTLIFCTRESIFETNFTISGPIGLGSSYSIVGPSSITLLCDGTHWWITASHG